MVSSFGELLHFSRLLEDNRLKDIIKEDLIFSINLISPMQRLKVWLALYHGLLGTTFDPQNQ